MRSVKIKTAGSMPSSTALVMVLLALTLGFTSTLIALRMNAGQAYADLNESRKTIGYASSNAQYEIELTPDNEVNDVGAEHLLTATVTTTGTQPVTGVMVAFSVISGPTVGVTGSATTDANGQAFFSYTGDNVGTDTIEACFTPDSAGSICDQAIKQWVSPAPAPTIDLTPDSATNTVGESHILTATVTTTGTQPVTGVMVAFSVISGPTDGVTGSATTDANGQAFFSYTGDNVGTDTIEACFTPDSAGSICDRAIKQWVDVTDRTDGDSCQGENSCRGKNITIGDNSCNSGNSCGGDNIAIGDNSCNEEKACRGNNSVVGDNSCNSEGACRGNGIAVGNGSCNHEGSCRGNDQIVGNGSCNGEESCRGNRNTIEDDSCNGKESCRGNHNSIDDDSCNGERSCRVNNEAISDGSCNQGGDCSIKRGTQEDNRSNIDVEVADEEDEAGGGDKGKGKKRGKDKD